MLKSRLVACLIMRDGMIVQSFGFKQYLPIGSPKFAIEYVTRWDVDEIVFLDISATQQSRLIDGVVLEALSERCFVPLTVGGGISSVKQARQIVRAGSDKVSINSHALRDPKLISELAEVLGSQCVVVSIDAKQHADGHYQVFSHDQHSTTEIRVEDWALRCEQMGAGEIFLNSVDRDGSRSGYDLDLIDTVCSRVSVPVICCGGVGRFNHFTDGLNMGASAVAAANIFQHVEHSTILAKSHLLKDNVNVRLDSDATYRGRELDSFGRLKMIVW